jgi:hypothetical protein
MAFGGGASGIAGIWAAGAAGLCFGGAAIRREGSLSAEAAGAGFAGFATVVAVATERVRGRAKWLSGACIGGYSRVAGRVTINSPVPGER